MPYRDAATATVTSPRARFIQWRAVLRSAAAPTTSGNGNPAVNSQTQAMVENVSIAYLPRNVAPEVLAVTALPIGVGLQQAMQVQTDPNVEASGLDKSLFGPTPQVPPRRVYQRGALSLQWQGEDRNGDKLEYAVYYRALNNRDFHLLKDKLRDNFYTIDGAALADGRYVFKVVASDAPDNPLGQALTGERVSEPVDIDNMSPTVRSLGPGQVTGDRVRVRFAVEDATGVVRRADMSLNGGEWRAVFPEDGIADSGRETYTFEVSLTSAGEHVISLRAADNSGNMGSARITVRR